MRQPTGRPPRPIQNSRGEPSPRGGRGPEDGCRQLAPVPHPTSIPRGSGAGVPLSSVYCRSHPPTVVTPVANQHQMTGTKRLLATPFPIPAFRFKYVTQRRKMHIGIEPLQYMTGRKRNTCKVRIDCMKSDYMLPFIWVQYLSNHLINVTSLYLFGSRCCLEAELVQGEGVPHTTLNPQTSVIPTRDPTGLNSHSPVPQDQTHRSHTFSTNWSRLSAIVVETVRVMKLSAFNILFSAYYLYILAIFSNWLCRVIFETCKLFSNCQLFQMLPISGIRMTWTPIYYMAMFVLGIFI